MKLRACFLIPVILNLTGLPPARAQDQDQAETLKVWGGYQVQGSATAGFRFADVKGYRPMYLELYDLQKGFRVNDFNMFGTSQVPSPFADQFSLTMSGLGGDPFPSAQLSLSKRQVYDLRVNWRQAYYYWNQNDGIILPPLVIRQLTNNHDWANVRKLGSVNLTLHATNHLRFNFEYYRTSFDGATFTTFSPDFVGSPGFWGTYARANPFPLYSPILDSANRFTGGLDYTWNDWNFHYKLGYQTYTETSTFNPVSLGETSINPTGVSPNEPLANVSWSDYRQLKTPVSEFSYVGKPRPWMEMRGGYIYYRYRGPASFDQAFNGIAPNSSGALAPYSVSQDGRTTVAEPNDIVDQGFTFNVKPWWDVELDYRYSRFTTNTVGTLHSLFNGTVATESQTNRMWRDGIEQLDLNMKFTPASNLLVRPGLTLLEANVETIEDGDIDDARTLRTKTVAPILSVFYQPFKRFTLRGDIHSFTNGASYTAIAPHTDVTEHVVGSLHITDRLALDDEVNIVNQKLLDTNFHGKIRQNSTVLTFALNDRYSVFAGFTYDDEFVSGDIVYVRGTTPLVNSLRDQALNRVWQAGLEAKPLRYLGFRFSGNFDRTTGLGAETGQKPAYGPVTWPLATGTVYVDFPKAGRLSLDLQRTYYIQQILTGNNFSANLLAIRWTRNF